MLRASCAQAYIFARMSVVSYTWAYICPLYESIHMIARMSVVSYTWAYICPLYESIHIRAHIGTKVRAKDRLCSYSTRKEKRARKHMSQQSGSSWVITFFSLHLRSRNKSDKKVMTRNIVRAKTCMLARIWLLLSSVTRAYGVCARAYINARILVLMCASM
jgi:hypothetical protein